MFNIVCCSIGWFFLLALCLKGARYNDKTHDKIMYSLLGLQTACLVFSLVVWSQS